MLSSFFGVAVIAMPASIVTAGFMDELNKGFAEAEKTKEGPAAQGPDGEGTDDETA